jgi:hypothetical protein
MPLMPSHGHLSSAAKPLVARAAHHASKHAAAASMMPPTPCIHRCQRKVWKVAAATSMILLMHHMRRKQQQTSALAAQLAPALVRIAARGSQATMAVMWPALHDHCTCLAAAAGCYCERTQPFKQAWYTSTPPHDDCTPLLRQRYTWYTTAAVSHLTRTAMRLAAISTLGWCNAHCSMHCLHRAAHLDAHSLRLQFMLLHLLRPTRLPRAEALLNAHITLTT